MTDSPNRKALIYCCDAAGLPFALFSASQAARLCPERDFDIVVCGVEALTVPPEFTVLGITSGRVAMDPGFERQDGSTGRLPREAYARLWLPQVFADRYDRILYLDSDTYILTDRLGDLMQLDLGGHPIAGVRDIAQWRKPDRPVWELEARGLPGRKYLNSGVLLFDTARYNACNALDRMLETNATQGPFLHCDQSLINLTLGSEWAELSPVWNWQRIARTPYSHGPFDPCILHFCGSNKPWRGGWQTMFPRTLANEYQIFLRRHFPQVAVPQHPPGAFRQPYRSALRGQLEHAWTLGALYRYIGRFRHDLDVLT